MVVYIHQVIRLANGFDIVVIHALSGRITLYTAPFCPVNGIERNIVLLIFVALQLVDVLVPRLTVFFSGNIESWSAGWGCASPSRAFYASDLHIAVRIRHINGDGEAFVFAFGIAHLPSILFTIAACLDLIAVSVDGQGIVVCVRLHVIFPT